MLRLADDMMRDGKSQKDICKELGISVMTFHRWRKHAASVATSSEGVADAPPAPHSTQIADLKLENARLRRIVSDLLLEKMKVQEALDKAKR